MQILEAQTRKLNLGDDVILLEVARFLPDTVTGKAAIRYVMFTQYDCNWNSHWHDNIVVIYLFNTETAISEYGCSLCHHFVIKSIRHETD